MIRRSLLAWTVVCFSESVGGTEAVRGPYLQNASPQSVTIKWRTDEATESIVRYGTNLAELSDVRGNLISTTNHEVQVSGLLPDQRYFYSIGTFSEVLAGPDENHFFVTPPVPGTKKPTRIWAIGDCGAAGRPFVVNPGSVKVRDGYLNFAGTNHTDVWLMLGDNAYDSGTDAEYQRAVFQTYPTLLRNTLLWSTLGNHDTYEFGRNAVYAYHDIFTLPANAEGGGVISGTENYYSFDYANIHFVCLDSELSAREPDSPMAQWLHADLSANANDWTIAFWHSPPYSRGSHDSDNMNDNFGNMTFMRTNFVSILESYGVDLVLCGHSHSYERSFLINGHHGFADSLLPEMIKDAGSGQVEDTGAYRKPAAPSGSDGAVYVVAGSSSQISFSAYPPHPVMLVRLFQLGSMVIDVSDNRLDAKFLRETGAVDDHFTIIKGESAERLRIARVRLQNGDVEIAWKSQAGSKYQIEQANDLQGGPWEVGSPEIIATGATCFWFGAAEPDAKVFYRVKQLE
jgi:acid phosphatase type 7